MLKQYNALTRDPALHLRDACWMALTRPTVATFECLANRFDQITDEDHVRKGALASLANTVFKGGFLTRITTFSLRQNWAADWQLRKRIRGNVMLAAMVSMAMTFFGLMLIEILTTGSLNHYVATNADGTRATVATTLFGYAIISILWGGVSMVGLQIANTIRAVTGEILGGGKRLGQIDYVTAAYFIPLALIIGVLRLVPFIGWHTLIFRALYGAVVSTIAIKAVYRFGWGRAILTNLIPILGAILIAIAFSIGWTNSLP